MIKSLKLNKTNTEKLNSLRVGDCLCTACIGDFTFNNLDSFALNIDYYSLHTNGISFFEFKVEYASDDYILMSWWDYPGYYIFSNLYKDE